MNHLYRSIWNAALGSWVAAPETARSASGKSSGAAVQGSGTRGSRESLGRARLGPLALAIAVLTGGSVLALGLAPGAAWAQDYGATGGAGVYGGGAEGAAGEGPAGGAAGTEASPDGKDGNGSGSGGGGGYSHIASGDVAARLQGGNGGYNRYGAGGGGGAGGDGVRIRPTGPSASINAAVAGGGGGDSSSSGGGGGGAGVAFLGDGALTVNQKVSGGNGGGGSGGGGGGGAGVIMQDAGQLTANAEIAGGGAGAGGNAYSSGNAGVGVLLAGKGSVTTTARSSITGGSAIAGSVGRGGDGVLLLKGGTIDNAGAIHGGSGGGASSGGVAGNAGGMGSGGALGFAPLTGSGSAPGGAGIRGAGISITNSGTIAGGTAKGVQADAIAFTGGSNELTLKTGSILTGAINIFSGAQAHIVAEDDGLVMNNAIVLGGEGIVDTHGNAFEVSGAISGAGVLGKAGVGTLTLTGDSNYLMTVVLEGSLVVRNGGKVQNSYGLVRAGGVTVTGTGSAWDNSGELLVGYDLGDPGRLTVADGGMVSNTNAYVGSEMGSNGSVTVTGDHSTWANSAELSVGTQGTGTLTIENGGVVTNTKGFVGDKVGSTGSVTVTGGGSIWANSDELQVGFLGSGTLTIESGGTVQAESVGLGNLAGSTGVLNLTGDSSSRGALETTQLKKGAGAAELNLNGGILRATVDKDDFLQGFGAVALGAEGVVFDSNGHDIGVQTAFGSVVGARTGIIKQGTGTLSLSGANTYSGTTTINAGTLALGAGGKLAATGTVNVNGAGASFDLSAAGNQTIGSLAGVAGSTVTLGANTLTVGDGSNRTFTGVIGGTGGLAKQGTGTLTLSGANTYSGTTTINAGTLALGAGGKLAATGAVNLNGAGAGFDIFAAGNQTIGSLAGVAGSTVTLGANTLTFGDGSNRTFTGVIGGTGGLAKQGTGTLTLSGANTYSGTTTINAGTLALGAGGKLAATGAVNLNGAGAGFDIFAAGNQTIGSLAGVAGSTVTLGANTLTFGDGSNRTFTGVIGGTGGLAKQGTGTLTLFGANTYSGTTDIRGGQLVVDGSLGGTGAVTVANGGTLAGKGSVAGAVAVANGGALDLAQGQTLSTGALTLDKGAQINAALGLPSVTPTALMRVTGDLALNGTVNVRDTGGLSVGVYRLMEYTGQLSGDGLAVGSVPTGNAFNVQTAVDKQVNLVNTGGQTLQFWDGSGASKLNNGRIDGGNGTWTASGPDWTDQDGLVNAAATPQPGFAIFQGSAGTVNVAHSAGAVTVTGMQFATDGYVLQGDAVALSGTEAIIRVGDTAGATTLATIASALSGAARLEKTGDGTLILAGANTYTGGTLVSAGTLQGDAISLRGAIENNAKLVFAQTADGSYADAISGRGSLSKTGAGTLTLTGDARHTGGTLIAGGTLRVGNGGITGALAGVVVNNATLAFERSDAVDFGGAISGTGAVVQEGTGTLTLTGDARHTGGTLIAEGTLRVGNGGTTGALAGAVVNNATLAFARSDAVDFGGAISGTGAVVQEGTGTLTLAKVNGYSGGTVIRQGTLAGNAASFGSGSIDINASGLLAVRQDSDADFANSLSGNGTFTKGGSAALNLTGNSSAFTGTTAVQAGTLAVNGTLGGSLAVHDGATLTGKGTVGSTAILAGATLAPGAMGTLHVAGDLRFASGATYQVQADPDSNASSQIAVTGTATLAGSVVHVGPEGGFEFAKTYTILQAGGGLSGQFDSVASHFAYLDPKLQYDANAVQLQLQRKSSGNGGGSVSFADLASTPNQVAVAANIEAQGLGALYSHVLHLPAESPGGVFEQLSGDSHANVQGSLPAQAAIVPRVSLQHLRRNMRAGQRPGAAMAQSSGPLPAAAWPSSKALPLWAEVVGRWQTQDGDGNAARTRQHTGGLLIGGDEEVGNGWRLGGSLGYTRANGKVADRSAVFTTDSYSATVYGGKSFAQGAGHLNVQGGLAYTWHDIATERQVSSLEQTLKADYRARTAQLFAEVGYALGQYGKVGVEPFAGITVGQQRTGAFQERGGFAALTGQSSSENQSSSTLGLRGHSDFKLGRSEGRLRASLGWRHAFGDLQQQKTMAFAGAQNFTVAGAALARNTAVVGLDAELELSRRASLVLEYRGEYGSGSRDHTAGVAVRWAF